MITKQFGFWQDVYLANTRQKLAELYYLKPEIAQSDKTCLIEYWSAYEGLSDVLGDKSEAFTQWFRNATSPSTIERCLRALKEDGTIQLSHEQAGERQEQEQECRSFWGNQKRLRGD